MAVEAGDRRRRLMPPGVPRQPQAAGVGAFSRHDACGSSRPRWFPWSNLFLNSHPP